MCKGPRFGEQGGSWYTQGIMDLGQGEEKTKGGEQRAG